MSELRSAAERKQDVLERLSKNEDAWLATASDGGTPRLIAVSSWWDGTDLVMATREGTPTGRNLQASGAARLALGSPGDVIMIDAAVVEQTPANKADPQLRQGFAAAAGWDPGDAGTDWTFFRLRPTQIEAYRGYGELEGRMVMRQSRWRV